MSRPTVPPASPDCDRPFDVLLELDSVTGSRSFFSRYLRTAPGPAGPIFYLPARIGGLNHGPLRRYISTELFVSVSVDDPDQIPQFGSLSPCLPGSFIVGPKIKSFIEEMTCDRQEFLPVSVDLSRHEYRDNQPVDDIGGGDIVRDVFHIWSVFNRLDLIDPERSTRNRAAGPFARHDMPGSPEQSITIYSSLGPLVLTSSPYEQADIFQLLGFDRVFVSPAFARRVRELNMLGPIGEDTVARIMFRPFHLELESFETYLRDLGRSPRIRVYGTEWITQRSFDYPYQTPLSSEKNG